MEPTNERPGQSSSYLTYLPAVFQQGEQAGQPTFVGRFLLAFEHLLTGLGDVDRPGIEEILDGIVDLAGDRVRLAGGLRLAGLERYFEPGPLLPDTHRSPVEFLEWLAGWVALTLRADLDELRQRDFIARAVSFYSQRGTRRGLEEIVKVYTRLGVTVNEMQTPFQIGVRATIGEDTVLDGGAPHFFRVLIRLPTANPAELATARQVATAIIDMEKPAHTYYDLDFVTPTFQIGICSRIAFDTLLGPTPV